MARRSVDVVALVIDPSDPLTLHAGLCGDAVFKSTDGAEARETFEAGPTCSPMCEQLIDPSNSLRLYAGSRGGGVFHRGPTGVIFADGFETGDTGAWSSEAR